MASTNTKPVKNPSWTPRFVIRCPVQLCFLLVVQSDFDLNHFNCFHNGDNNCCLSYHADGPLLPAAHWTVRLLNPWLYRKCTKRSRFINNEFVAGSGGGTIDVVCAALYYPPPPRIEID